MEKFFVDKITKKEYNHAQYIKHKAYHRAYGKNRYQNDKEFRTKLLLRCRETQRNWRIIIIGELGGKCVKCGFNDIRALQVDHINGDGNKERRMDGNGTKYYKKIIQQRDRYQILCANCNFIKRIENKEHRISIYE